MRQKKSPKPLDILLVEDSPLDIKMFQESFLKGGQEDRLHIVNDGEDAIEFIKKIGKYANCPRPDIVFLDLNLPRKDGKDVLAEIKSDASLRSIPVVVVTSSRAHEDVHSVYDLHANCYINKPTDIHHFVEIIQSLSKFWLTIVTLPSHRD